jgi:hypothetical protein
MQGISPAEIWKKALAAELFGLNLKFGFECGAAVAVIITVAYQTVNTS